MSPHGFVVFTRTNFGRMRKGNIKTGHLTILIAITSTISRTSIFLLMASSFLLLISSQGFGYTQGGLGGGGEMGHEYNDGISPSQREEVQRDTEVYEAVRQSFQMREMSSGTSSLYSFYPVGGTIFGDLFVNNYIDLNSGSGILDWDCGDWTYDGHDALDIDIRSFGEQDIGVPIFAVQDGTVISTHDGEFDKNTGANSSTANYVVIDHGNGRVCNYWHMKKNSVLVSPGQLVVAGQQIGSVGSSGNSTQPHLHFATYQNGSVVEPDAGSCRSGQSLWVNQILKRIGLYVRDFGISGTVLSSFSWPSEFPRNVQVASTDDFYPWIMLGGNLPANSTYLIRIYKPNGSQWYNGWSGTLNGGPYRNSWWWWGWSFSNNTEYGTWRFVLYINGIKMLDAPFVAVASYSSTFNRAPNPITLSLEPSRPTVNDVIVCRVGTDLVFDDPDYDIVRYNYEWRVNGLVMRQVTSAAQCDVLRKGLFTSGNILQCTVTPSDGKTNGTTVSIAINSADVSQDMKVDLIDYSMVAGKWAQTCSDPAWCNGMDIDRSGIVDFYDIHLIALHWLEGAGE